MKKFLKKFIINIFWGFLITPLLIAQIILLKKINPIIIDVQERKLDLINYIDVGFFGDSHMKGGIDPIIFNKKTGLNSFTFANSGKPLYFSSLEINKVLSINPETIVVLDLGSNNQPFFETFNYLQGDLFSLKGFKENIKMYSYLLNTKGLIRFLKIDFINTSQSILNGALFDLSFLVFQGKDINTSNYDKNYKQSLLLLKEEIELSKKTNHLLEKDFEINELLNVIKKYPKSKFIIIRPPETITAKNIYPQKNYNDIVKKIIKYNNVIYKDFSEINLKYNKDFNDLTHLSKNGMKKFTEEFIIYFKNLDIVNKH